MKNIGFKITLLIFFIALLSGFYMRLSLMDNLVRSFVIYLIFSLLYLAGMLVVNQLTLESFRQKVREETGVADDDVNHASPNIAK